MGHTVNLASNAPDLFTNDHLPGRNQDLISKHEGFISAAQTPCDKEIEVTRDFNTSLLNAPKFSRVTSFAHLANESRLK